MECNSFGLANMDEASRRAVINETRRRKRKSRGRGLRRTTGCLTCKRRHLKCDEVSPECGPCAKSKHSCLYERRPAQRSSPLQNLENVDSYGLEVHQASQVSPLELTTSPKHAAEPILSPFPSIGNTQPPNLDQSSSSDSSYYQATTPPDAAFYRWFGLLACDAATADDADALRLGIPSTDPTDSAISLPPLINGLSLESFRERYAIPNVIVPCLSTTLPSEGATREPWHGSEPARLTDAELCLLDNFVRNVSFWIDLHDPHNTFSTLVPHLAMRDAGLMTAILALSSRQLSISPDASSRDQDGRIGLQYYYDTLRYLQQAMTIDAYTVSLELLATALIVSMYEMLDDSGNGSGWGRHLKGVFWIQRSQLIQGETGGLKSAVWWAWLRQDVWAAFRERRKTLSFWTPTKAYVDMTAYEMAARIVWIFAKAVDFCSEEEISAGQDNVRMRIERADTLFDMLNKWEMHLPDEFKPLPGPKKKSPSDFFEPLWIHPPAFAVSIQLHHAARILVLLHKPSLGGIRGYAEQQRLMKASASTICRLAMMRIDSASSLMSSQCLYIAGLSLQKGEERETVVRLIDDCHSKIGWPRQSLSHDLKDEWVKLDAS